MRSVPGSGKRFPAALLVLLGCGSAAVPGVAQDPPPDTLPPVQEIPVQDTLPPVQEPPIPDTLPPVGEPPIPDTLPPVEEPTPPPVTPTPPSFDPDQVEAFFDGLIRAQLRERRVAGAVVAVVHEDEVVHLRGYGYADVERRRPVDPERSLFRIGSVTKLFTYLALMQLEEEGLLDLGTSVNTYLDFQIPDTYPEPITPFHLMTHTAGFEEDLRNLFTHSPARMVPLADWVRENLPARVRPPGEFASYSNYGSALAGHLVEHLSGMSWDDYLEERILGPLGMDRTTGRQPLPTGLRDQMSQGYVPEGGGFEAQPWEYVLGAAPAGSISATGADMAIFMRALLAGGALEGTRILEAETLDRMLTRRFEHHPRLPGYALGFYEMELEPVRVVGHGGNTGWFHTVLALVPEHDLGIFVSYNTSSAAPLTYGPFLHNVLDRYFPLPETPPVISHAETLAPLTGTYRFNRVNESTFQKAMGLGMTVTIRGQEGALEVQSLLGDWRMVEVDPLLFREETGRGGLAFRVDEEGRATHAFLSLAPMMVLERIPWHATPFLHFVILGGGMVLFLGLVLAPVVRGLAGWRRHDHETAPRALKLVRWCLFGAGAANVAFVLLVAALVAPDLWDFLTTPMTGFVVALALPVIGALGIGAALAGLGFLWIARRGPTRTRVLNTLAALGGLLFLWSLHYWNLLGWHL